MQFIVFPTDLKRWWSSEKVKGKSKKGFPKKICVVKIFWEEGAATACLTVKQEKFFITVPNGEKTKTEGFALINPGDTYS